MVVKYREKAISCEKQAGEHRFANRGTHYNPEASECYEEAGDNLTKQAVYDRKTGSGIRKINTALSSAAHDYNLAIKYLDDNNPKDVERIEGKIGSIEKIIQASAKYRTARKINSALALPILSIVAFSFALLLSSFSITGFLINETMSSTSNYIALACFAAGLVFAVLYLRKTRTAKKKSSKKKK